MRQVLAREHGWLAIGGHGDLHRREADLLAEAELELPRGCLEWGHQRVKFRQFCGVVRLDNLQIEVLPKLSSYQSAEHQRSTLLTLLSRGGELNALDVGAANLGHSETLLLDIFIRYFAQLLDHQLRHGMLQDYRDVEDNLGMVRGRIDMVRQQRENLAHPQRIACRFNELSTDTPVNRLLRTTLDLLQTLVSSPLLRQYIASLRMRFAHVPLLQRHERAPCGDDLNRMQRRYAPVVDLAHLFLSGQYLDVRSGQSRIFSLLFDMNRLFERYTASLIEPEVRLAGLSLQEQGPRQHLITEEHGRDRLLMRPDIALLDRHNTVVSILDTKWKILAGNDPLAALSTADLYQISTYAAAYGCSEVGLFYPEQESFLGQMPNRLTIELGTRVNLTVHAVPVSDPSDRMRLDFRHLDRRTLTSYG